MNFVISWIVATISATGYAGIAGLMALESACIPLPSEIIMPFGGYLASTGQFSLVAVATAGTIGCNIGSTVAYLVGAYGGRVAVLRWGKYVFFDANELDRFDRYFKRYGSATVLAGRLLPVVRTFISLPAGMARMPFIRFQIFTFIGSWPWCFALAYLGLKLGEQWNTNPEAGAILQRFNWIVIGLLVCAAVIYIYRRWRSGAQQIDSRRF